MLEHRWQMVNVREDIPKEDEPVEKPVASNERA
jgi:hypothetical protein